MAQRKIRTPALEYTVPERKPQEAHVVISILGVHDKGLRFVLNRSIIVFMIINLLFSVEDAECVDEAYVGQFHNMDSASWC